jgi:hypothetical protein
MDKREKIEVLNDFKAGKITLAEFRIRTGRAKFYFDRGDGHDLDTGLLIREKPGDVIIIIKDNGTYQK